MTVLSPCFSAAGRTGIAPRTVREAMVTAPKTCGTDTTVGRAREMFGDDHVHSLLLVRGRRLVAVVHRSDLDGVVPRVSAASVGSLDGRVIAPDQDIDGIFRMMLTRSVRRLAVVDGDGNLLGLLCLKRSRRGFCSDGDVRSRAEAALVSRSAAS